MQNFPVDIVVTYVDDKDYVWQKAASQYNVELNPKRYRSWDIFQFWFRSVEKNMPWIRTIHLVVSNIEQVPTWLDQNKVHVVLHKDIIPKQLLPTFNSTTIEMYLHKIPGLAEHFIYSNDDMFAIDSLSIEDFFKNGIPIYEIIERTSARNVFRMQCKNSYSLASKLSGKQNRDANYYFYIKHSMDPMLKSVYGEVHQKAGDEIFKKCTKFREPWNFTQYLFPDYALMVGRASLGHMPFKYFAMANDADVDCIDGKPAKVVCVNDTNKVKDFDVVSTAVNATFSRLFKSKSTFETLA